MFEYILLVFNTMTLAVSQIRYCGLQRILTLSQVFLPISNNSLTPESHSLIILLVMIESREDYIKKKYFLL